MEGKGQRTDSLTARWCRRTRGRTSSGARLPSFSPHVLLADSDRNAEELGAPLVNQFPQISLQTPPENRTGDKASAQGSGQVRP